MAAKKLGTPIGALDELLLEICVGDTVVDAQGRRYTVDKNCWYKPTDGGSSRGPQAVGPVTVEKSWNKEHAVTAVKPERNEEEENLKAIKEAVKDAGDQTLVDELRSRGWVVKCTKMIEKVVFEEVAL